VTTTGHCFDDRVLSPSSVPSAYPGMTNIIPVMLLHLVADELGVVYKVLPGRTRKWRHTHIHAALLRLQPRRTALSTGIVTRTTVKTSVRRSKPARLLRQKHHYRQWWHLMLSSFLVSGNSQNSLLESRVKSQAGIPCLRCLTVSLVWHRICMLSRAKSLGEPASDCLAVLASQPEPSSCSLRCMKSSWERQR